MASAFVSGNTLPAVNIICNPPKGNVDLVFWFHFAIVRLHFKVPRSHLDFELLLVDSLSF